MTTTRDLLAFAAAPCRLPDAVRAVFGLYEHARRPVELAKDDTGARRQRDALSR
jgi:hypothetical protein